MTSFASGRWRLGMATLALLATPLSCGDDGGGGKDGAAGGRGQACYPNGTCDDGLICVEGTCADEGAGQQLSVALLAPGEGEVISGSYTLIASVEGDVEPTQVEFFAFDESLGRVDEAPFKLVWDSTGVPNGDYRILARATDAEGQMGEQQVLASVDNRLPDDAPPAVSFLYPIAGASLCGAIDLEAMASDDDGIEQVEFRLGRTVLGTAVTEPYRYSWDTTTVADGAYELGAVATDTAGQATQQTITVEVDNSAGACDNPPVVVLTAPERSHLSELQVLLVAQVSDDAGVVRVQFFVDNNLLEERTTLPYEVTWDASAFDEGPHLLKAMAYDTADQMAEDQREVTLDRTPPTVAIAEPVDEAAVDAAFTVTLDASDAFGLERIEVLIDDAVAGEAQAAPWTVQLEGVASGVHTLTAVAHDLAGNTAGSEPVRVAVALDAEPLCTQHGWCWVAPRPQGANLEAIDVVTEDDVWVGGADGTVLHWDGLGWTMHDLPADEDGSLPDVIRLQALADGRVWVVSGQAFRWDGEAWTGTGNRPLTDVWASGADTVYGTSEAGVHQWQGDGEWTTVAQIGGGALSGLSAIWGSSEQDVWAVGTVGNHPGSPVALHYDGAEWTTVETGATGRLNDVWGLGPDAVWIVGDGGTAAHWDGETWTSLDVGTDGDLVRVRASAADDVWVYGSGPIRHWDGASWLVVDDDAASGLSDIAVDDLGRLWGVGYFGEIRVYDGQSWEHHEQGLHGVLAGVWGNADDDVWLVGWQGDRSMGGATEQGVILHWDGNSLSTSQTFARLVGRPQFVYGRAADQVWVVGREGTFMRWDGESWSSVGVGMGRDLFGLWAAAEDDIWIAGDGTLAHYNGVEVDRRDGDCSHLAVHGSASNDVWAVGGDCAWEAGVVMHWDGQGWVEVLRHDGGPFSAVWASSPDDVWVAGSDTFHWDGGQWTQHENVYSDDVYSSFWRSADGDLWLVGGALQRWDGASWTRQDVPGGLHGVWVSEQQTVWVAGVGARVLMRPMQ